MSATDLLYSDPLAAAEKAAQEIAERSGVARHDIALVMGSGWVDATEALGSATFECNTHYYTISEYIYILLHYFK